MLLVTANQVKYCQVIYTIDDKSQIIDGMSYRNKLFIKLHSFLKSEKDIAIQKAKDIYLENKGRFLVILVEEIRNYVIWIENEQVKIKSQELKDIPISEINLEELVAKMRNVGGVRIENHWYNLKIYRKSFVGNEAVIWLMNSLKISRENAIRLGKRLVDEKWIHHVTDDHTFKDEYLFYRFYWDEK